MKTLIFYISDVKQLMSVFENSVRELPGDPARMLMLCITSLSCDVICYVKNRRRIINAFVTIIKQTHGRSRFNVMPQ